MARTALLTLALGVAVLLPALPAAAQDQAPNRRQVTIIARDFRFVPDRVEVIEGDLVRLTLTAEDAPVSVGIDAFRVMKRVDAGQSVTVEFRADRAGDFPYYCTMTSEPRCREMKGTLHVAPR